MDQQHRDDDDTVVAVNDPMVANNDRIVTNIADGSPFTVPEWVFLANDTDPDGVPDITAVTESSSGFSVALGPTGITITDTDGSNNSFTYTGTGSDTASVPVVRDTVGTISGDNSNTPDILVGNGASSTFDAGTGNDFVLAGAGDDTIVWFANNSGSTDGRDFVDGGTNAAGDTFQVNGNNSSETYNVYAVAGGQNADLASTLDTTFNAATEIVITRTVGSTTTVVAELDNIEELTVTPSGGTDAVNMIGDFTGILNLNTLTVSGGAGADTIDVSAVTSQHRLVAQGGDGNDNLLGGLGDDTLDGGAGADTLSGGAGNDMLNGGAGSADLAVFTGPVGNYGFSLNVSGFVVVTDIVGTDGADTLIGVERAQFGAEQFTLRVGTDGNNTLTGNDGADLMLGFGGADIMLSSGGGDIMVGGSGADTFTFTSTATANGDAILDFTAGDQIDLSAIDANQTQGHAGNQAFALSDTDPFSDSDPGVALDQGQVRYEQVDTNGDSGTDSTSVQGNVNNDLAADFEVVLQNHTAPVVATDFVL